MLCDSPRCQGGIVVIKFTKSRNLRRHFFTFYGIQGMPGWVNWLAWWTKWFLQMELMAATVCIFMAAGGVYQYTSPFVFFICLSFLNIALISYVTCYVPPPGPPRSWLALCSSVW